MDISFLGIQKLFENSEDLMPEASSERIRNEKKK